jgi:phage gp36-like protein
MSYATLTELTERYGAPLLVALTAEPPADEIDEAVVARALADAGALIDGYLKGRYRLPLPSTPPLLRDLALAIAFYKLHRQSAAEKVRQDYDDALRVLGHIASGAVRLDVAGAEPAPSGNEGVRTNDRVPDMTPGNMKGFV